MNHKSKILVQAGFWYRICASLIDFLIVYVIMWITVRAANIAGFYIPSELTYIIIALVYGCFFSLRSGKTPGKSICGISIEKNPKGTMGFIRIIIRESIGKLFTVLTCLSPVVIFPIWQVFSLKKHIPLGMLTPLILVIIGVILIIVLQCHRAIHDHIGKTTVFRNKSAKGIMRYRIYFAVALFFILLLSYTYSWYKVVQISNIMAVSNDYKLPSHSRSSNELVEIDALKDEKKEEIAEWLDSFGSSPNSYIIEKALKYQLIILGEEHEQKETLSFFNKIIPILYKEANVTCIGMETFMASENQEIEKLVTASQFDHQKAIELARRMDKWGAWGFKGYWQVMETVWKINHSVPKGKPKIKIVGLGVPIDVMSFSVAGFESGPGSHTPFWEKFRMIRIISDLPEMISRDALMAHRAMVEILDKGRKGVILVGAAHSTIKCPMPGRASGTKARMGFMLARKFPNDIFQIMLHKTFESSFQNHNLASVIESIMGYRNHQPVGFDVTESPLASLRDSNNWMFKDPRLGMSDIATGYIYLSPLKKIHKCDWVEDYVSQSMYVANKPFYNSLGKHWGKEIKSADDVNKLFQSSEYLNDN